MYSDVNDSFSPADNRSESYTGYTPKTPADFECFIGPTDNEQHDNNPGQTIQQAGTHAWLTTRKLSFVVFGLALAFFAASLSISVFKLECKLGLCLKLDRSSTSKAGAQFENFTFVAPFNYVWAAFTVSILGIAIVGIYSILIELQKRGISELLADFAAIVRLGLKTFFVAQLKYYAAAALLLLILVGLLHSWRAAGCFLFGAALSILMQYVVNAIIVRGVPKTIVGAQHSVKTCLEIALRNGAVIGIVVISLAVGGVSISYLVFQDLRALQGYILGVSVVSLLSRLFSCVYKRVSTAEEVYSNEGLNKDARNPSFAATTVGQLAGNCASLATGMLASHSIAVVATAILGASFPFFYKNPYALCVFNHLSIDRTCVSYESPTVKASIAASICRRDGFYTAYDSLTVEESNTLFVGLPFILAFIGILSTSASCLWFIIPATDAAGYQWKLKFPRSMKRRHLLYTTASSVISLVCAGAVCWVLFGGNSAFATANSQQFQLYELQPLSKENAATRCRPLEAQEGSGKTGLPALRLTAGQYRPIDMLGREIPAVSQVPLRLFLCFLIGAVVAVPLGITPTYFSFPKTTFLRKTAFCEYTGAGEAITQGLGISMLAAVIPMAMLGAVIGGSYKLFGVYGIGIAAIGLVCSAGTALTFQMVRPIADAARDESCFLPDQGSTDAGTEILTVLGVSTFSYGGGVLSASTFLSLMALVAVIGENAGFFPSSPQLVGSTSIRPSRHITDYVQVSIIDVYVMASSMIGILVPWLLAATLLMSDRYIIRTMGDYLRKFQQSSMDVVSWSFPGLKIHYLRFMDLCSSLGVTETIVPGIFAIINPLIIGFGFGRQALFGFVLAVLASSFMLSVTIYSLFGVFDSVRNNISLPTSTERVDPMTIEQGFRKELGYCCAPVLNAFPAVVATIGGITVQQMSFSLQRGWIGIILLIVLIVSMALMMFLIRKREESVDGGGDGGKIERIEELPAAVDPTYVSPFYEDGPRVELTELKPSSGLKRFERMEAVGFSDSDNESFGEWYPVYNNRNYEQGALVGVGTVNGPSGEFKVTVQEVDCVHISH